MKSKDTIILNDGQIIDMSFAEKLQIAEYCDTYNGKTTVSFVGAIIQRDKYIVSFPKYYELNGLKESDSTCIRKILTLISLSRISLGSFDSGDNGEFPVKAYWEVASYYKKYGLYQDREKYNEEGYAGNIDWNRTVNQSNKLLGNNGIIFFPFVLRKSRKTSVFLSECMDFVLTDAFNYTSVIDIVLNYKNKTKNRVFNNLDYVINQLNKIKRSYFKDTEKSLIHGLIEYLQWKSQNKDNIRLLTLKFEDYWEKMVGIYLNGNFAGYSGEEIHFQENSIALFEKPKQMYIESKEKINERKEAGDSVFYRIELDHLYINDTIYIFDSKYFNEGVKGMNYKQAYYHYHMKSLYPESTIVNGLIMPTNKEYYTKTHIDRSDIDGVKITEHYLNLHKVVDYALEHKEDMR